VTLPYVYQLTKYDPADRDERGYYVGDEDSLSDHGPVEAAYLDAVAAFAADSGVTTIDVREPGLTGSVHFGLEAPIDGHGLAGQFAPDLRDFHDGARVSVPVALELLRAMLRDNGAFCRLDVPGRFFVHVGWDQYVYVGSACPCDRAVVFAADRGLFPERLDASPYEQLSFDEEPPARRADDAFFAELAELVARRGAILLEEGYLLNVARWHRITGADLDRARAGLAPRCRLRAWPDLRVDVAAALAELTERAELANGLWDVVWRNPDGTLDAMQVDHEDVPALPRRLADATGVAVVSVLVDEAADPLLAGVLPDPDGVLRARWRA
jgi:hypothetical protein